MRPDEDQQPPASTDAAPADGEPTDGDFRGPYGFGRPSHRPDPQATYGFKPEAMRVLPVRPKSRWR